MSQYHHPTRAEYVAVVRTAARGTRLRPAIKRKLTLYAKQTKAAVYGRDYWASGACPLRAVGVTRNEYGAWLEDGAHEFAEHYDRMMRHLVHVGGPCLISVRP